jgi:hypothetical protein
VNALQKLRDSGFTVELVNGDLLRIRPQCPPGWLSTLKAAKPEIIAVLRLEQRPPLYIVKTSPQLRGLAVIRDDRLFIEACIAGKTHDEIIELLSQYRSHWLEAVTAERSTHCKDNAGRFAANTWLRENVY